MSKSTFATQRSNLTTIVLSFIGTLAALPLALMLYGAPDKAAATNYQVNPADSYAQYAHAYTQGYLAQTTAGSSTADTTGCGEVLGAATASQNGASAYSPSGHTQAGTVHVASKATSTGGSGMMDKDKWVKSVHNSYNSYSQAVVNNNYKNSHNVVGSNNTTKTEVNVKDSKGVLVHTNNTTNVKNTSITDSFNKDSYNTEHKTTVIKDSFNETKNTAIVKDSYNDETTTNTTTVNTTTENVGNTDNSSQDNSTNTDNSVDIKDNEVEVEIEV